MRLSPSRQNRIYWVLSLTLAPWALLVLALRAAGLLP